MSLSRRLAELKDRCQRSFRTLEQSKLNTARRPETRHSIAHNIHASCFIQEGGRSDACPVEEQLRTLKKECQVMKYELMQADGEIEDLEKEFFEAQQGADRTPGALLFFAALQDDGAVPTMQQLVLQLGHLKSFVDGSEHLDFPTMRKRLQVCVECLPNLSKFIDKYSYLHQRWELNRKKAFATRKLSGGDADSASLCILCNHDSRQSAPVNGGNILSCTPTTMQIHRSVERSSKLSRSLSQSVAVHEVSPRLTPYRGGSLSRPTTASVVAFGSALTFDGSSTYIANEFSRIRSRKGLPITKSKNKINLGSL